ncbi:hypothetical protein [Clostridium mediterraneense]|uniref:hypothetical protein n=1 Tax=Clostridium mediterraneense TaxID=1805472 RepID=UPI0008337751|nr:hypothetical protein [Clostridium mediterraneense]
MKKILIIAIVLIALGAGACAYAAESDNTNSSNNIINQTSNNTQNINENSNTSNNSSNSTSGNNSSTTNSSSKTNTGNDSSNENNSNESHIFETSQVYVTPSGKVLNEEAIFSGHSYQQFMNAVNSKSNPLDLAITPPAGYKASKIETYLNGQLLPNIEISPGVETNKFPEGWTKWPKVQLLTKVICVPLNESSNTSTKTEMSCPYSLTIPAGKSIECYQSKDTTTPEFDLTGVVTVELIKIEGKWAKIEYNGQIVYVINQELIDYYTPINN